MPEGERHAKLISCSNEAEYFMSVTWRDDSFDITVTDAERAWEAFNVRPPEQHRVGPAAWWAKARLALTTDTSDTKFTYETRIKDPSTGNLDLAWIWKQSQYDVIARITLTPVVHTKAAIRQLLILGTTSYQLLLSSVHSLEASCADLKSKLDATQAQLALRAREQQEHEGQLYLKFSVLLNEKKRVLRDLREQLEETKGELEKVKGSADQEQTSSHGGEGELSDDSDAVDGVEYNATAQQEGGAYEAETDDEGGSNGGTTGTATKKLQPSLAALDAGAVEPAEASSRIQEEGHSNGEAGHSTAAKPHPPATALPAAAAAAGLAANGVNAGAGKTPLDLPTQSLELPPPSPPGTAAATRSAVQQQQPSPAAGSRRSLNTPALAASTQAAAGQQPARPAGAQGTSTSSAAGVTGAGGVAVSGAGPSSIAPAIPSAPVASAGGGHAGMGPISGAPPVAPPVVLPADNWDLAELAMSEVTEEVLPSTSAASRSRGKRPRR